MVNRDSIKHCDIIAVVATGRTIKACMDVDASLRIGPLHLGVRRSPVHTATEAYALAAEIAKRQSLTLSGLRLSPSLIPRINQVSARVLSPVPGLGPAPGPGTRK